jgi:integrase
VPKAPSHPKPLRCPEAGINLVHQKTCSNETTAVCDCDPSFQGQAWSKVHQRNLRRTFKTLEEARLWRQETIEALTDPTALAPGQAFFDLAAQTWLKAAKSGAVRTRSGTPFKPAALRSYEDSIRRFLIPRLGRTRLADITRPDIQDVIDRMVAEGYAPSTVRNAVLPLRSILRRALDREEIEANPTERLDLPIDRRTKDRVAPPEEVDALLEALPENLRLIWALALYTGLRRGELQALGWKSVDLEQGTIEVERSWDRVAGFIDPKSRAGFRRVPLPGALRPMLVQQNSDTVSGRAGEFLLPFDSGF